MGEWGFGCEMYNNHHRCPSHADARTDALEVRAVAGAVDHGAVAQEVDGPDVVRVGGGAPVFWFFFV